MALPYTPPLGGSRLPVEKPGPKHGPAPMHTYRQPVGGVRPPAKP